MTTSLTITCNYAQCRIFYCYSEHRYAECRCAECRCAECRGASSGPNITSLPRCVRSYLRKTLSRICPSLFIYDAAIEVCGIEAITTFIIS